MDSIDHRPTLLQRAILLVHAGQPDWQVLSELARLSATLDPPPAGMDSEAAYLLALAHHGLPLPLGTSDDAMELAKLWARDLEITGPLQAPPGGPLGASGLPSGPSGVSGVMGGPTNGAHPAPDALAPEVPDDETPLDELWIPPLAPQAFHGFLGQVLSRVELSTEADPPAILIALLVLSGNLLGRGPHIVRGGSVHAPQLYAVLVGPPATGRKGTAVREAARVMEAIDRTWERHTARNGLSTGEGLIHAVRDPRTEYTPAKKAPPGAPPVSSLVDPGIADKRLMILEDEFGRTLRIMQRDTSTLSGVLRAAWDGGDLRIVTKGAPEQSTGAHISLIGNITPDELRARLSQDDISNGLASRILWVLSHRARLLPSWRGLRRPEVALLREELRLTIAHWAGTAKELEPDAEAEERWQTIYPVLSAERPGVYGALTARGDAQVARLSLVYAALDRSDVIRIEHLEAALAVWEYCASSVRFLWGEKKVSSKLQVLLDFVKSRVRTEFAEGANSLSRTQIMVECFHRHISSDELTRLLNEARRLNYLRCNPGSRGSRIPETWEII